MKSVYPFSTSLRPANYLACWKSAALGVEFLFMGKGDRVVRPTAQAHGVWLTCSLTAPEAFLSEKLWQYKGERHQRRLPHSNHDIKYASISVLNKAPKLDQTSGRYKHK